MQSWGRLQQAPTTALQRIGSRDRQAAAAAAGLARGLPCAEPPRRPPPLPPPCVRAGLSYALCDSDPLCITEQANFDQLCSLLRAWGRLDGPQRRQLVDSLTSSLTCLTAWIDRLLAGPPDAVDREALITHRSAFKAYLFFLQWLAEVAAREAREAEAASETASAATASTSTATGRGRGGRGKKAAAAGAGGVAGWDWSGQQFPKIVKNAAQVRAGAGLPLAQAGRALHGLSLRACAALGRQTEVLRHTRGRAGGGHAGRPFLVAKHGICLLHCPMQALNTDLRALFRPNRPEEGLLVKAIQLVGSVAFIYTTLYLLAGPTAICRGVGHLRGEGRLGSAW